MPKKQSAKTKEKEDSLKELLTTKLKALYDIETQIVKALPKMAKKATDPDLKAGFEKHLRQTEEHVNRLERAFDTIGEKAQKLACDGIRGIIADGEWVIKNVNGEAALDANLVAAAQYVEHYEMAGYRSAIAWARLLGENDVAELLQLTFDEEEETSNELTELASSRIDEKAMVE